MKSLFTFLSIIVLILSHALFSQTSNSTLSLLPKLPPPDLKHNAVNPSKVMGWRRKETPKAPLHFKVIKFAKDLRNGRWIYVGPNGDIFVAESMANRISIFRDTNGNGNPELREIFLSNLNKPFGMLILHNWFYVANTDSLWRYPYKDGMTKMEAKGEKILDLPGDGNHWTRNIIASPKGNKIYISVGSTSNIAENGIEKENSRAAIWQINPDGSNVKIFATGLRNPVGLGFAPGTNNLWTTVNERDFLGDDLVPDFFTEVKEGAFYGWPYSYFGNHPDPRLKGARPDLVMKAIAPDVSLGAHTASLGLVFYEKNSFPPKYHEGAFIAQHGSWNRSTLVGYKVIFIPFKNGRPSGFPEDFLTGFISNINKSEVSGRPVGVAVLADGSLLVADDGGNTLWKISYSKQ